MKDKYVKFVVTVPITSADLVREALGTLGVGKIGSYSFTSFSVKGIGRFRPEAGADPSVGKIGRLEEIEEERIETVCLESLLQEAISAVKKVHPYEEIIFDIYPLLTNPEEISKNEFRK